MNELNKQFFEMNGFESLTSVQEDVLNNINQKRDLIVLAPTGTGKTHSFLFSILEKIEVSQNQTQAIILAPTRELAMQIFEFSKKILKIEPQIRIDLVIGGMDNTRLKSKVERQPHILIATPGKLLDVFSWSLLRLDTIKLLIIDEMDMMFDYGFVDEINAIASHLQDHTRFMLFSATLPQGLQPFIKKYLHSPLQIESKEARFEPKISHVLVHRRHLSIEEGVLDVLTSINPLLAIVFANTKEDVISIAKYLRDYGIDTVEIHGDVSDRGRKQVVSRIRSGTVRYIVATDLAARGIDLPEISHVINANIPHHDLSFYTHRAGRTGRTGRDGYCISLVTDKDQNSISRLLKQNFEFKYMRVRNNTLVEARSFFNFEKRSKSFDSEIAAKVSRKNVKVKPGYKKRHKREVEKLMAKKKREVIRKDIRRQKKERAIERQRSLREE